MKFFNYVVLLISPTYYFKFTIKALLTAVLVDPNSHSIITYTAFANTYTHSYFYTLEKVLFSINTPSFLKLTFRGKGYYLYKSNRNTITPQFNYSHRLYLYTYFLSVKFLNKTTVLFYSHHTLDILHHAFHARNLRPINIFTGRGVRFAKQIVYKKTGKVSAYR